MPAEIINDFVTISESARENEGTRRHINQIEYSSALYHSWQRLIFFFQGNEFVNKKKRRPPLH